MLIFVPFSLSYAVAIVVDSCVSDVDAWALISTRWIKILSVETNESFPKCLAWGIIFCECRQRNKKKLSIKFMDENVFLMRMFININKSDVHP
jgi:hypothetical protein